MVLVSATSIVLNAASCIIYFIDTFLWLFHSAAHEKYIFFDLIGLDIRLLEFPEF